MEKPLKVLKVGGSWDLRLTPAFIRANKLHEGDYVIVDMSKVRVLRAEDFAMIGRAPVLETRE
jgi:hypothetical protein